MSIMYYFAVVIIIIVVIVFFYRQLPKTNMPYRLHRRKVIITNHRLMIIEGSKIKPGSILLDNNIPVAEVERSREYKEGTTIVILNQPIKKNLKCVDILIF